MTPDDDITMLPAAEYTDHLGQLVEYNQVRMITDAFRVYADPDEVTRRLGVSGAVNVTGSLELPTITEVAEGEGAGRVILEYGIEARGQIPAFQNSFCRVVCDNPTATDVTIVHEHGFRMYNEYIAAMMLACAALGHTPAVHLVDRHYRQPDANFSKGYVLRWRATCRRPHGLTPQEVSAGTEAYKADTRTRWPYNAELLQALETPDRVPIPDL